MLESACRTKSHLLNLNTSFSELIMSLKLAELIKGVRECKTQQEERALVNKEKANIRQSFTVGTGNPVQPPRVQTEKHRQAALHQSSGL